MANNMVNTEVDLKVPGKKFWDNLVFSQSLFPKILSPLFKSIEVIEGEEGKVGCVKLYQYGEGMPVITFAKERFDAVDHPNMCLVHSFIEGEILSFLKTFKATVKVSDNGGSSDSCVVKWSAELEAVDGETAPLNVVTEILKETTVTTFKAIEEYLLAGAA